MSKNLQNCPSRQALQPRSDDLCKGKPAQGALVLTRSKKRHNIEIRVLRVLCISSTKTPIAAHVHQAQPAFWAAWREELANSPREGFLMNHREEAEKREDRFLLLVHIFEIGQTRLRVSTFKANDRA